MPVELPEGALPVKALTTGDILYGNRVTEYRWEILTHADGIDTLAGSLDGVVSSSASLNWNLYTAVKGSGTLKVSDLAEAQSGFLRIGDIDLSSARVRPVLVIEGLPEIPWGVYLFTAAPEAWSGEGRVYGLELLDKCTVLDQDFIEESYTVDDTTSILEAVAVVVDSAGETISVDASETSTLAAPMVWKAGTSKLKIVNDLLRALNYNALWVDGVGNFRATPYVEPASRGIMYEILNGVPRELVDGELSIYSESWARDRDLFDVPNKVITIQAGTGASEPLTGVATNENPDSPFSYPSRGRWRAKVVPGVEVPAGSDAEIEAFLDVKARASLIASSAVQAAVDVKHLPIPIRVSDVLRFANAPAGIDTRHTVTSIKLSAHPLGLMSTKLQEVIDL